MSASTVERLTRAQAEARRAEIIASVGGDEKIFRSRAEAFVLDARELALFNELLDLDYLLAR